MRFSVVIPAYNSAATVDATVKSVLAQMVIPDQILVLDDRSTDDTFRRLLLAKLFSAQVKWTTQLKAQAI